MEVEDMGEADGKRAATCGDAGGVTLEGGPCSRPAGWGTGRTEGVCKYHLPGAVASVAERKQRFIEQLQGDARITLTEAARRAGVGDPSTVFRWRKADDVFDAIVAEAMETREAAQLALVEDSVVTRIIEGRADTGLTVFYLVNRGRGRWRDVRTVRLEQDPRQALARLIGCDVEELPG
jgi:hypothetical protein